MLPPRSEHHRAELMEEADFDRAEVALLDHFGGDPVEHVRGSFLAHEAQGVSGVGASGCDIVRPVAGFLGRPEVSEKLAGPGIRRGLPQITRLPSALSRVQD